MISYGGGWEEEEVSCAAAVTAVAADGTMVNKNKMANDRIAMGISEMHSLLDVSRRFFIICLLRSSFVCVCVRALTY